MIQAHKLMQQWCDHCKCLHQPPVIGALDPRLAIALKALNSIWEGRDKCEQYHCSDIAERAIKEILGPHVVRP